MKDLGTISAAPLADAAMYFDAHPLFKRALEFLQSGQHLYQETGDYAIDGENLKYSLVEGSLKDESQAVLESHKRYIDIHYVVSGTERIGWKAVADCSPKDDYNPETDLVFYRDRPGDWIALTDGYFAIFCPGVAHAPMVGAGRVKKIVIKVKTK